MATLAAIMQPLYIIIPSALIDLERNGLSWTDKHAHIIDCSSLSPTGTALPSGKSTCSTIDYFPLEEYSPDPNDSTMAIPCKSLLD